MGNLIRDARIEAGMSISEMAEKLKRSRQHVSQLEGKSNPTVKTLEDVADALNKKLVIKFS